MGNYTSEGFHLIFSILYYVYIYYSMSQGNGVNYIMRTVMNCILTQYCSGDKIENNEMGGACSAYGGEERGVYRVLVGKETTLEFQEESGG